MFQQSTMFLFSDQLAEVQIMPTSVIPYFDEDDAGEVAKLPTGNDDERSTICAPRGRDRSLLPGERRPNRWDAGAQVDVIILFKQQLDARIL
jgi:hypothetical protein